MHKLPLAAAALASLLTVAGPAAATSPADELKAFPAAEKDQVRHVITLPAQKGEENYKVELLAGKMMTIDCNIHRMGGALEQRTATGWGYNYYVLEGFGPGMSTLMGCPEDSRREAFVPIAEQMLVRYNSRLPLVVYAPKDAEIRYRIWTAGEEHKLP